MTGKEFRKRAKRYAKARRLAFRYEADRGKGSHGLLHVGDRRTIVSHGELATGTVRGMLKQLGIDREDF